MSTPNGQKVQIALEELKELYGEKMTKWSWDHVDIMSNAQKEEWFLKGEQEREKRKNKSQAETKTK